MVLPLIISVILVIGDFGHRELKFLGFDVWTLWWIALSGSLGAIISMLLRIPDFIHLNKLEASTQLYAGLFRPIIGGSFALLVYFIVYSEVLGVGLKIPAGPGANAFFLAASFVAGFSERLAPTIAAKTEEVIVGRQQVPG